MERTLLLQCVLTGRAQLAYASLSVADSQVYNKVKTAVLKAYELVPEAYRANECGFRESFNFAVYSLAKIREHYYIG